MRSHSYKNTIISNNEASLQCKDLNTKYTLQNYYELTYVSVICLYAFGIYMCMKDTEDSTQVGPIQSFTLPSSITGPP